MSPCLLNNVLDCDLISHQVIFVCARQWWRGDCSGNKESAGRTSPRRSFYTRCGNGRMSECLYSHRHFLYTVGLFCWGFFIELRAFVALCPRKGEEIYHQLRRLGASLDWSRACFTMDLVRLQSHMLVRVRLAPKKYLNKISM